MTASTIFPAAAPKGTDSTDSHPAARIDRAGESALKSFEDCCRSTIGNATPRSKPGAHDAAKHTPDTKAPASVENDSEKKVPSKHGTEPASGKDDAEEDDAASSQSVNLAACVTTKSIQPRVTEGAASPTGDFRLAKPAGTEITVAVVDESATRTVALKPESAAPSDASESGRVSKPAASGAADPKETKASFSQVAIPHEAKTSQPSRTEIRSPASQVPVEARDGKAATTNTPEADVAGRVPPGQAALNAGLQAHVEKSAAQTSKVAPEVESDLEKHFLSVDNKELERATSRAGTDVALRRGDMKFASPSLARFSGRSEPATVGSQNADAKEGFSDIWKGWTNGGGERVSTAAQFSRLGENTPSHHAPFFVAPGFGASRADSAPAPASAPNHVNAVANSETDVMVPIGSAITRLVARGQDNLSLTVRFEQGGSLSLKLAMHNSEITSQIHTDVPGLEQALRSAWGQFAHDWEGRGLKLHTPTFSAESGTREQQGQQTASGQDQQSQARRQSESAAGGFSLSHQTSKSTRTRGSAPRPVAAPVPASTTSTIGGLQTWA